MTLFRQQRFWDLFIASFGALYFEILLVRWLPTSLYYLGFYKNCILFGTFLGYGIGCATRIRFERLLPWFGCLIAVFVFLVSVIELSISVKPWNTGELIWPQDVASGVEVPMLLLLLVAFVASAFLMIPLGQQVGRALERFEPVPGYSVNIFASLLGIGVFLALGALRLGPVVWFTIAFLPFLYLACRTKGGVLLTLTGLAWSVAILTFFSSPEDIWSPYHKLSLSEEAFEQIDARLLLTNNNGHQVMLDLRPEHLAELDDADPAHRTFALDSKAGYESAYSVMTPGSVLIVGGGTGNEAAAALRHGVEKVHVVEIDPVISGIGQEQHPERPYDDRRVTVFTDDARHYMAITEERYDLIIFGFLDSTSRLSSLSNIRLDNYVYTSESFRQARRLLTPNGMVQVTYYVIADFVGLRIVSMLEDAFGQTPLVYELSQPNRKEARNTYYFVGPFVSEADTIVPPGMVQRFPTAQGAEPAPATDDWPFLSLESRSIGKDYGLALVLMILASLVGLRTLVWVGGIKKRTDTASWIFFVQGMGFMLLETNTITKMALVMGSTWIVTTLAIAIVLMAALVANLIVHKSSFPGVVTILVFTASALLLNYSFDISYVLGLRSGVSVPLSAFQLYLPILGSSLLFARLFQRSAKSSFDFGMNILGALFGGMCEYMSMVTGVRSIYLLALLCFIAIGLLVVREGRATKAASMPAPGTSKPSIPTPSGPMEGNRFP